MKISRVAIIGLGLIGGSVGLSVREMLPNVATTGWDADADVRARAAERGLAGTVCDTVAEAVREADLVILCVPVGAMGYAAEAIAPHIRPGTIVSDVGSSKRSVGEALAAALPEAVVIPAHPVAGTENSGPEAGFATLFRHRWCIVTPRDDTPPDALAALTEFWEGLGATVEIMDPRHHDLVLAVTSHIPHLIAYTIVGTASDLEEVTRGEVIKYSATLRASPQATRRCGATFSFPTATQCSRCWGASPKISACCNAQSAMAMATRFTTCSTAPGRSAARSSNRARTTRARTSVARTTEGGSVA